MTYPPPSYEDSVSISKHDPPPITNQPGVNPLADSSSRQISDLEKLYKKIGNRLVFDFEKHSCCPGGFSGIDPNVKDQLPPEIAEKGVTHDQWYQWIIDLEKVQQKSPSICCCLTTFCFPGLIVQCILCAMFCPTSMDHCCSCLPWYFGDWHGGLHRWQEDVNKTLNKHEMHAKLATYKPHGSAPKSKNYSNRSAGKDEKYEMSFLLIALGNAESLELQCESWDHGVYDGCTSGIGRAL